MAYLYMNPQRKNTIGFMSDVPMSTTCQKWNTDEGCKAFSTAVAKEVAKRLSLEKVPDLEWNDEMETKFKEVVASRATYSDDDVLRAAKSLAATISMRVQMKIRLDECKNKKVPHVTWTEKPREEKKELENRVGGSPFFASFMTQEKSFRTW